jgi:tRNA threonylcarbamoyladenosine biosynthesis protein TsaE
MNRPVSQPAADHPVGQKSVTRILRQYRTTTEAETEAVAAELLLRAEPGEVFGLTGELGAGKTVFVRGAVRALGGDSDQVHSPTFTIMNVYAARIPVHHFDLYRIEDEADLESIGFLEFAGTNAISLIEWADRIPYVLKELDFMVHISLEEDRETRLITVSVEDVTVEDVTVEDVACEDAAVENAAVQN